MVDNQLRGSFALGWRYGTKQTSTNADKFSEKCRDGSNVICKLQKRGEKIKDAKH